MKVLGGWAESDTNTIYIGISNTGQSKSAIVHEATHIVAYRAGLSDGVTNGIPSFNHVKSNYEDYPVYNEDGERTAQRSYAFSDAAEVPATTLESLSRDELLMQTEGPASEETMRELGVLESEKPGQTAHILSGILKNNPAAAELPGTSELEKRAGDTSRDMFSDIQHERTRLQVAIALSLLSGLALMAEAADANTTNLRQRYGARKVEGRKTIPRRLFNVGVEDRQGVIRGHIGKIRERRREKKRWANR